MNSGEKLQLPKLYVEIRASAAGRILHLVQEERSETVVSVTGVKVSARKSGELCELAGGERILLVDTAPKVVPSDCDGVLLSNSDAHEWLQHKRLTSATESVGRAASERDSRKQWTQSFEMHPLGREGKSLRPPQYGGLCAIAAHWSLSNDVATIVMPTGTGKTETMLAAFAGMVQGTTLIVVPSKNLKSQTVGKFLRLGLLRELGVVAADVPNPVLGVLDHRPKDAAEIEFIKRCDVVVAVINTVGQGSAAVLGDDIANLFETLMIDEAHHVAATTWAGLRDCYQSKKVLQFTATPFRRDGKPIEGRLLYTYPLGRAQADGYFKKIHFHGITEADPKDGDHAIARAAVAQLRADLSAGFDHLIMARCETIERAEEVQEIYRKVAADLKPILVHSELRDTESLIKTLRNRASRIVVCVDMLGEGFDFPELKVAAVHDSHKSLAILLQFTGRFTRTGSSTIGEASVFANVATPQVRNALEALYTEDADWNKLLAELSSNAIKEQADLLGFLADTERLDSPLTDEPTYVLSPNALRVKFSTLVFEASDFHPKKFMDAVPSREMLAAAWLNTKARTLILVFRTQPRVTWTRAKAVHDVQWDLIVLHHDPTTKLVFVASTDHDASYVPLVQAVTGAPAKQVSGDNMFRVLGNISRLLLQIVGLKRHGTRRSISFSMFAGMNVREALSQQNRETSTKANVSGNGFESGAPTNAGCSYKGRVWSREVGRPHEFIEWARAMGKKLRDDTIDTEQIIANVLIPREIDELPETVVLCLDWPREILDRPDEKVCLCANDVESPLADFDIEYVSTAADRKSLVFRVKSGPAEAEYSYELGGSSGFRVHHRAGPGYSIKVGKREMKLEVWFELYPPSILFVDGAELEGYALVEPQTRQTPAVRAGSLQPWDWSGIDLTKESMWRDGQLHSDSIQAHATEAMKKEGFEVIIDDDGSGEAADLVCLSEHPDHIRLVLVHCKFSGGDGPGERIKDIVEVASQAIRSSKWNWRFDDLCQHLAGRQSRRLKAGGQSRMVVGDTKRLMAMKRIGDHYKPLRTEILIVQPGLSKANITESQAIILASAQGYVMDTVGVDVRIACSD